VNIDIHHHHYTVEYKAVNSTAHLELYDKVSQIANGVYTCEHFSKPYILRLMVKQAPQTHERGLANGTCFFVTIYVQTVWLA